MIEQPCGHETLHPASYQGTIPWLRSFPDILLPHVVRTYRPADPAVARMLATALAGNGLVAITSSDVRNSPDPRGAAGCLVRVTAYDSHSGIALLKGLGRIVIEGLQASADGDTLLRVRGVPDHLPDEMAGQRRPRRQRLLELLTAHYPELGRNRYLAQIFEHEFPLGAFCDLLAHSLKLAADDLCWLLREHNADQRCLFLQERLERHQPVRVLFPPVTSCN
ncbi:hypothetical protein [Planctomicrobium sp. SH664]|uniref:hypothetical protein n=1 Tax=Planctomicrobium sp. SH664 TaxID=3448125 RepID=UPI003F5AF8FE